MNVKSLILDVRNWQLMKCKFIILIKSYKLYYIGVNNSNQIQNLKNSPNFKLLLKMEEIQNVPKVQVYIAYEGEPDFYRENFDFEFYFLNNTGN